MIKLFCNGKKGYCDRFEGKGVLCGGCEYCDGRGTEEVEVEDEKPDRERLIELLTAIKEHPRTTCQRTDDEPCDGCRHDKVSHCDVVARTADYLIENGVTFKVEIRRKEKQ